jgi:hypothetical protein
MRRLCAGRRQGRVVRRTRRLSVGSKHIKSAARRLPYGNGPQIFGYRKVSMLWWTQAIENQRYYFENDFTKASMRQRGFAEIPTDTPEVVR